MPVAGRKLIYLMGSGRSSDEFLRVTGRAVAGAFDLYVCTDWARRPRPDPQTVPDLMRDGLLAGGVTPGAILSLVGEEAALHRILAAAAPGDLVLVNTAEIDSAAALIERFVPIEPAGGHLPGRGGPSHPVAGRPEVDRPLAPGDLGCA
jgi:cyanophycin synthetase